MKDGWRLARFGDVLDIMSGRNQRAVESADGEYAIYGSGGVMGYATDYLCEAGATIIGRKGSINSPILVDSRFWNVDTAFGLQPKVTLDHRFLFRFCQHYDFSRHNKGTTLPSLVKTDLLEIKIPLPSLAEQQRIVAILDEAFDAIASAKASAEKNLQNVQRLLESRMNSIFAELAGYPVVAIGNVADVFDGPHATPKTVDSGPVFLGINALCDGQVDLSRTRHVTQNDFVQWTRRVRPRADDVVFSYETRLGQAALIPNGLECCLGRRMGLVRPDTSRLDPRFFVYLYVSPPFRRFLESKTVRGATVDRISVKEFPSFRIPLPPMAVQEQVADSVERLRRETTRLASIYQRKIAALDELKQSLLHEAFAGNL